jgi:two-component system chemotaxis sensor kinase CheA
MDDLLREFLVETGEHLDTVDVELVRFEQQPSDGDILRNIFRLVHTIKGTCGFLGLPRLEYLAHAAEALMERLRDGAPPTREAVSLILATVDRLKLILSELERFRRSRRGSDADLIGALERAAYLAAPDAAARGSRSSPCRIRSCFGPSGRAKSRSTNSNGCSTRRPAGARV